MSASKAASSSQTAKSAQSPTAGTSSQSQSLLQQQLLGSTSARDNMAEISRLMGMVSGEQQGEAAISNSADSADSTEFASVTEPAEPAESSGPSVPVSPKKPAAKSKVSQETQKPQESQEPQGSKEPKSPKDTKAAKADATKKDQDKEHFDAKAFLKTVPNRPGCYRMYGARGEVIYVGKAKDLKKRLSSYFVQREQPIKTRALVANICHIEFTVTFSESEALILENELIKKYQPHYNILLRDDKSYPYLLLTSKHPFPGLYYHRGAKRKQGEYFGPFPDATAVKDSLKLLQRLFPVRQCEDTVFAHRSRPCLMAQMGRCLAPCVPLTPEKAAHYQEQVDLIRLFLQGHNQELLQQMVHKMEEHAERMEFEEAALLRDQLTALRKVQESNSIVSDLDYPVDVIGFAIKDGMSCIHVLFIRNGRIFGTRSFFPKLTASLSSALKQKPVPVDALEQDQDIEIAAPQQALIGEIMLSFLSQFYLNDSHSALIPDEVVLDLDFMSTRLDSLTPAATVAAAETAATVATTTNTATTISAPSLLGSKEDKLEVASQLVAEIKAHAAKTDSSAVEGVLVGDGDEDLTAVLPTAIDGTGAGAVTETEAATATTTTSATTATADEDAAESDGTAASEVSEVSEVVTVQEARKTVQADLVVLKEALAAHFSKNVRFVRGVRGSKRRFLTLAMTNAQVALQARLNSAMTAQQRIEDLENLLGISGVERMECYDISHTMGELTVGSCVVFNREGPDSMRYRRYNIEGITPGDDFAAMHQVLTRRFKDPDNSELPQLIFIDGGKGQLKQAEEVLTAAFAEAVSPMPTIVAVAKGEGRKEGLETLIRAFSHEKINLDLHSPALQLVLHIRDEAHRFAITGHRNRRAKARRSSTLENIAGVGPKRRQALLQHLGGMQEVMRAGIEELQKVPGISAEMASKIYDALHGEA